MWRWSGLPAAGRTDLRVYTVHSRTSWLGHGPQAHTKTGRWNQVLIMATAWLAQRSQHEPAPRIFSVQLSLEGQGPASEAARIRSCMHKKITLHVWWIPRGSLPNPACLQVHDAVHGHLPAAFGTTAAGGVSISPFPTWDLSRSLSRPALRASSDITIVFINQHATSAPGGFNVNGYNLCVWLWFYARDWTLWTVHDKERR